ncbi:unnamed protein product [Nesidiocoris tenuis]|uniref:Fibronectin type-III domain-containing protein n=1 Tax=Nesidiocoris tenuis TaxID=355587 RepID=A0A6H5GHF9_9HEMI|nr:unnamed protein product [Nesidiocoris tenuis]
MPICCKFFSLSTLAGCCFNVVHGSQVEGTMLDGEEPVNKCYLSEMGTDWRSGRFEMQAGPEKWGISCPTFPGPPIVLTYLSDWLEPAERRRSGSRGALGPQSADGVPLYALSFRVFLSALFFTEEKVYSEEQDLKNRTRSSGVLPRKPLCFVWLILQISPPLLNQSTAATSRQKFPGWRSPESAVTGTRITNQLQRVGHLMRTNRALGPKSNETSEDLFEGLHCLPGRFSSVSVCRASKLTGRTTSASAKRPRPDAREVELGLAAGLGLDAGATLTLLFYFGSCCKVPEGNTDLDLAPVVDNNNLDSDVLPVSSTTQRIRPAITQMPSSPRPPAPSWTTATTGRPPPPASSGSTVKPAISTTRLPPSESGTFGSTTEKPYPVSSSRPIVSSTNRPVTSTSRPISSSSRPISSSSRPISSSARPVSSSTPRPSTWPSSIASTSTVPTLVTWTTLEGAPSRKPPQKPQVEATSQPTATYRPTLVTASGTITTPTKRPVRPSSQTAKPTIKPKPPSSGTSKPSKPVTKPPKLGSSTPRPSSPTTKIPSTTWIPVSVSTHAPSAPTTAPTKPPSTATQAVVNKIEVSSTARPQVTSTVGQQSSPNFGHLSSTTNRPIVSTLSTLPPKPSSQAPPPSSVKPPPRPVTSTVRPVAEASTASQPLDFPAGVIWSESGGSLVFMRIQFNVPGVRLLWEETPRQMLHPNHLHSLMNGAHLIFQIIISSTRPGISSTTTEASFSSSSTSWVTIDASRPPTTTTVSASSPLVTQMSTVGPTVSTTAGSKDSSTVSGDESTPLPVANEVESYNMSNYKDGEPISCI